MRVVALVTHEHACRPIYESLASLGHHVSVIVYTLLGDDYKQIPLLIKRINPDWVFALLCCDYLFMPGGAEYGKLTSGIIPIDILEEVGKSYPFVHICLDGSELLWTPQLQRFHDRKIFKLQINIDGVKTGVIGDHGWTTLTPIDFSQFPDLPKPWTERPIKLGFCGAYGGHHPRTEFIQKLVDAGLLTVKEQVDSIADYRAFLSSCKCVFNCAMAGTGIHMHVKGRVLEAAAAGCLVFENEDSPTAKWFAPEIDYLSYETVNDIEGWVDIDSQDAQHMIKQMRHKISQYSSSIFWNTIINRI